MSDATSSPQGKRRPTLDDVEPVCERVSDGLSLRAACEEKGIHNGHMHAFLKADPKLWAQYTGACASRAEFFQERALVVSEAAALNKSFNGQKVDAAGARVYLEAIKWSTARMDPKSAPVSRMQLTFEGKTDQDLLDRLAELEGAAAGGGDDEPAD